MQHQQKLGLSVSKNQQNALPSTTADEAEGQASPSSESHTRPKRARLDAGVYGEGGDVEQDGSVHHYVPDEIMKDPAQSLGGEEMEPDEPMEASEKPMNASEALPFAFEPDDPARAPEVVYDSQWDMEI